MTKAIKTSGQKARQYVQSKTPFTNHNGQLYGQWVRDTYIVYSYGEHWPLFIWDGAQWYENEDKYSPTTSKHRSQTHPLTYTEQRSLMWMRTVARTGLVANAA
jgi:hypothetical protein